VLRLSLHPDGLAGPIVNFQEWRLHIVERLRHQIHVSCAPVLIELMRELQGFPAPSTVVSKKTPTATEGGGIAVAFELIVDGEILSFLTTTTVFGTPVDITLSELATESFFPADSATARALSTLAYKNPAS
jgi:hypothetical protein